MLRLSGLVRLRPPWIVVEHELDAALAEFFPGRLRRPQPWNILGFGIEHAGGVPMRPQLEDIHRVPVADRRALLSLASDLWEEAALAGTSPDFDLQPARMDPRPWQEKFQAHLDGIPGWLAALPEEARSEGFYAQCLSDILDALNAALNRHGVPPDDLMARGRSAVCEFVDTMPSRRVDVHLHRQWSRNPTLRSKPTDLNDFAFVGVAVAYCDVVVTDKKFADLVNRGDLVKPSRVIASLEGVADLVAEVLDAPS
jgi:hypothetical protein